MMNMNEGSESHRIHVMNRERKWDVEADETRDKRSDKLRAKIAQDFEYLGVDDEKEEVGFRRSQRAVDVRNEDITEMNGLWRAHRTDNEGMRYAKEGSSNFLPKSSFDRDYPLRKMNDVDELNAVDYAVHGRTEHLNKLDELQYHFTRPDMMSNKGKGKVHFGGRIAHQEAYVSKDLINDESLGIKTGPLQHSHTDSQFRRPSYQNQYDDPPPLMRRQEMGGNGSPQYPPSHVQGYEDPLRSQMPRKNLIQNPALYQQQQSHAYIPGRYMNDGIDPYGPIISHHHPSCSCFQCRNKREVPPSVQSSAHGDKFSDVPNDTMFKYRSNHGSFGPGDYNQRITNLLNTRWSSDVKSEVNGFTRSRPHRVHLPSGGQHCRPIAGGAPFLMCHSCHELLRLPKKLLTQGDDRMKVKCGECSIVIYSTFSNKNLVVLVNYIEAVDAPVKVENAPVIPSTDEDGCVNHSRMTFSSDDIDNPCYDIQYMDQELGPLSTGNGRDNNLKNRGSTLTHISEAGEDSENLISASIVSSSIEQAAKSNGNTPHAGSYQETFGYAEKQHGLNKFGGSDKNLADKTLNKQNSMQPVTEIDISSYEYPNSGATFDSTGGSSKQGGRTAKSFFAGIADGIFRDSKKTNQTDEPEKANVTVNGHLIPDKLIKKAERLAGPILPGHYWYDYRAGFWGVTGGPCIGILPPFIPEFHYPMPKNCSGGNTSVFVNGRELCEKDLHLLGRRGMPTHKDGSYIIEISGRILDESSGEELAGLGKLAPTVEKAKHGFGMRDPNEAATALAV